MSTNSIRAAYSSWPRFNDRFREAIGRLTAEQLAVQPSPERWPLWATIGHVACQRVSGLCGYAGEPGAETTPFPNALYNCPGDEDLEHVLDAAELVVALDSTFAIIERCLDSWTWDMLSEVLTRQFGDETWTNARGAVLQRTFAHDIYHFSEVNEALTAARLPLVNLWE
jgi:hypothetical protein